ncbi:hypothetical protein CA51_43600 [Rosistilla oblonga]|uniref:hypothetical protein n=1 Tax=Rosistilla oblonga TaxID=2527990 RepID=UPI001188AA81|nr:hypothetical protein [Rosistilla oblonga]QDV14460.1 hypothetical protein CA51_43600 [Rosistilla oblonga]
MASTADETVDERVYTLSELAKDFGVNRTTIWRWCDREGIGRQIFPSNVTVLTKDEAEKVRGLIYDGPGNPCRERGKVGKLKATSGRRIIADAKPTGVRPRKAK